MQANAFSELACIELANVVGGQEASPPPNHQEDTIGVKAGDKSVGWHREGERSNYGLCVEAGIKGGWTPAEIKDTCGTPPK